MSEVKKIATRESYGHALVELGKEHEEVVVPRQVFLRRNFLKDISTAVLLSAI